MATLIYSRFLLHPTSLFRMATAAAESAVVAVNPSGISHRKISTFTRVSLPANTPPSLDLQCRSLRSAFPSVKKAQVATIEQAATEAPQKVESPVVIITGASRGIGKAVALALGKAAASRCFSSSAASSIEKKDLLSLSEVEKILHDVRADDIKVIPSPKGCEFADYIVIATGRSPWHVRNISQALIYKVKQKQLGAKRMVLRVVGQEGGKWIVIDSGKLIVHAVDEKARAYYNFEGLWSTRKSNVEDSQMQDLEMAFVKVRPKNNSKRART